MSGAQEGTIQPRGAAEPALPRRSQRTHGTRTHARVQPRAAPARAPTTQPPAATGWPSAPCARLNAGLGAWS